MEPERCAECGFDATRLSVADAIVALRSLGPRWRRLFKDVPPEQLRRRPDAKVWSALEYAAHTRDVLALHAFGLDQVLDLDRPTFPSVEPGLDGPDHGYNDLDPSAVLDDLAKHADALAARASREVGEAPWSRTGVVGSREVDAGYLLRHALHDATHHLRDVERGLKQVSP